jgi:peptidyl-prolyl cis-trans isomerase A (cyclophilin A)
MCSFQRFLGCCVAFISCILLVPGCGSKDDSLRTASISPADNAMPGDTSLGGLADPDAILANPQLLAVPSMRRNLFPEVIFETSAGNVRVRLDAQQASETVDNFLEAYAKRGFYDGTIIHYVESGFIMVGGGYTEDLVPKETRAPIRNEAQDAPLNKRGTIAMSRQAEYVDSATSQFFFNLSDNTALDHDPDGGDSACGYCVFGEVVDGMDVLDRMAGAEVHDQGDFKNLPVTPIVITKIKIVE